jgi:hypothetical protein
MRCDFERQNTSLLRRLGLSSSLRRRTNFRKVTMKTEKEVKAMLKKAEKELKEVQKQFDEYDNHDDMEELDRMEREVETLKKVLS